MKKVLEYICYTIAHDILYGESFSPSFKAKLKSAYLLFYNSATFEKELKKIFKEKHGFIDSETGNDIDTKDVFLMCLKDCGLPLPNFMNGE